MAVTLLQLSSHDLATSPVPPRGDEQTAAAADALGRRFPLLLFRQYVDPSNQNIVLMVHAPQVGDSGASDYVYRVLAHLKFQAIIRVQPSEGPLESTVDEFVNEMSRVGIPIIDFNPDNPDTPDDLSRYMEYFAGFMSAEEVTALPLFTVPAGGEARASLLVDAAVRSRFDGRSREEFAAEALWCLEKVLGVWSYDSAISWLRSANTNLGGARPIEVLALHGPSAVASALEADEWGVFT